MTPLSDIEVFVRVVEAGGFTAASEKLRIGKSAVSRCVSRLEDGLGVRLLNRTTRRLSLTEAGQGFYERAHRALGEIETARVEASRHQSVPSGTLRVAAPMSFGIFMIAPLLAEFMRRYPQVVVDLELDDRHRDIVAEGIDVAVRITQLADSGLIARRLAPIRHVVAASPAYLKLHGTPRTPDALRDHDCLIYTLRASPDAWRFDAPDGGVWSVPVRGSLRVNNALALREALLGGRGLGLTTTFVVGDDLRAGRLVRVLADYATPEFSAYAVFPQRRHVAAKVRAFVDFLASRFGDAPPWDDDLGFDRRSPARPSANAKSKAKAKARRPTPAGRAAS